MRFGEAMGLTCTRPTKDDSQTRQPAYNEASVADPEPPPIRKRPISNHLQVAPPSLSESMLDLGGTRSESKDVSMRENDSQIEQPRKRAAIGDGISAGSASPLPFRDPESPPRRSKARPISAPYESAVDSGSRMIVNENRERPSIAKKTLWSRGQQSPPTRALFDPSNIASIQAQKRRNPKLQSKFRNTYESPSQALTPASLPKSHPNPKPSPNPSAIFGRPVDKVKQIQPKDEAYDIILQPETRPISQEQLVAEVKGIYAGLVMVEAKCIEVDKKQASLAATDSGSQPKLNNEQWQALIALHRTLLHEHHDFFLASQHPSASPALRRLASKYAMPARMWRHGIHSFLELLRHRLPASLDHMLAFIYLAYSMMALLYETVPAFEDTWIECLGDLGRYRMAIEDDDIRDREVWTGVARHWYSKASDKAPSTGRLYHHLAILARPSAIQQLFYYSKSLCVAVPFASARESILTLFDPVLNNSGEGQYRLPPLDTAFVKAHGLLFSNKDMAMFEPVVREFLGLLDNQIGRVSRKFMEQGYHIAVANSVAMLGFASKENDLMRAIADENLQREGGDHGRQDKFSRPESHETHQLRARLPRGPPWPHPSPFEYLLEHGTMHGFERHPWRNNSWNRGTYRLPNASRSYESMLQKGLSALGAIGRKTLSVLQRLDWSLKKLAIIGLIQAAEATSQSPLDHVEAYDHRWTIRLRDLVTNNIETDVLVQGIVLLASSLLILRYDKDLLGFTSASVGGALYLSSDETVSNVALATVCFSSAGLITRYHSKKFAPFPKTSAATGTIIVILAILSAEVFRRMFSPLEGRYANPFAFHMVANLPAMMIMGWLWEAFILRLDFAKRFEDAFSNSSGYPQAVCDMVGLEMVSEIFSAEEINARYQSWLHEKRQRKTQNPV